MTPSEPRWSVLKRVVAEALELPVDARDAHLDAACPDPARRAEATLLLRACEQAAASPILDLSAAEFAAPILAEVREGEDVFPEALRSALAGRYTIERELGRGGMATVFLAYDERHARRVALKLLRPEFVPEDSPTRGAARFQREIEFAARLSHPHILPLHDSGAVGGLLYYITPYVDGETLRERLAREGRLPLTEACCLLRDVARALAHAHREGVVHRDIKPANILLNQDGDAVVADFGVAKGLAAVQGLDEGPESELTDETLVLGTPAYMAPEQVIGAPEIDHRADLYALGAVAYELLTGAPPFAGRPRHEQLAAHLSEMPAPVSAARPDVPPALAALVGRLLAKRPEDRPRDAGDVLRLLDSAQPGASTRAGAAGSRAAGGRWLSYLKLAPAFALLVLLSSSTPMRGKASAPVAATHGTDDRLAYELNQKGQFLVATRQRDGLQRALGYFEQAIARDTAYASAYAGIADAWSYLGVFGHAPPHDAFPRARAAAERAIALDSLLAGAHAALAHMLFVYEWNWAAAEPALERAIALGPRYPLVRMYYASYLHSVGRPDEALEQLKVAREIDPLIPTGVFAGRIYIDTDRPDDAIRALQEEIDLEPRLDLAHQFLAHAYLQQGRGADAIESMRRGAILSGARDTAQLAYVYAATGNEEEARRVLAILVGGSRPLGLLGFHLAMAYGALGDADEAFRWLEAAYQEHAGFMNLLAVATGFDAIRSDPRFDELLQRMGLG